MAIRELQGRATGVNLTLEQIRRFNAVNYRLDGSRIKAALAMNPGKVILAPRESGKSTSLAEYMYDNYPDGAIIFVRDVAMAEDWKMLFPRDYLWNVIIVWGGAEPDSRGRELPIFADEIFLLPGVTQKRITGDRRFAGAVGTPYGLSVPEVRALCILY